MLPLRLFNVYISVFGFLRSMKELPKKKKRSEVDLIGLDDQLFVGT